MISIQNEVSENRAELKEQLRIQEDRLRRNNIRDDGIEEDENKTWYKTQRINRDLFCMMNQKSLINVIEREHTVLEKEKVSKLIVTTLLKLVAKFLDYKEKEEVM